MHNLKSNEQSNSENQGNSSQTLEEIGDIVFSEICKLGRGLDNEQKLSKTNDLKDFGLDSLDHIELMMFIEQKFHINVSEEGFKQFTSVEKIAEYVMVEIRNQHL